MAFDLVLFVLCLRAVRWLDMSSSESSLQALRVPAWSSAVILMMSRWLGDVFSGSFLVLDELFGQFNASAVWIGGLNDADAAV